VATYSGWGGGPWGETPWGQDVTYVYLDGWGYGAWGETPWGQGSAGVQGTGAIGAVTVQTQQNALVDVTGVQGTGQIGQATVFTNVDVPATGVSASDVKVSKI